MTDFIWECNRIIHYITLSSFCGPFNAEALSVTIETPVKVEGVYSFLLKTHCRAMEHHLPYGIRPWYLPPDAGEHFNLSTQTWFTYPGWMKGWVGLGLGDGLPICRQSVIQVVSANHLMATGRYLDPVFPSLIKSNLISNLLISDQLDVQNWSLINCDSFFHAFSISNYVISDYLICPQLSLLYASLIGWQLTSICKSTP